MEYVAKRNGICRIRWDPVQDRTLMSSNLQMDTANRTKPAPIKLVDNAANK